MSETLAKAEIALRRNGHFDPDSDYGGKVGPAVMELLEVLNRQGHSGFSAQKVLYLFHQLAWQKSIDP